MQLDLSSLTFLVVEDSAYMRTILRTMLQGFGARRIVEAEDGASGLEAMDRAMRSGLGNVHRRIAQFPGCSISIESHPGEGTKVTLRYEKYLQIPE